MDYKEIDSQILANPDKLHNFSVEPCKRPKFTLAEPEDENRRIVSMIEYKGQIFVATEKGVYRMENGEFVRLKFVEQDD